MKSPLICLLSVVAFALYPLERARAISIFPSIGTFVESRAGGDVDQRGAGSGTTAPLAFDISSSGAAIAASAWSFLNASEVAVWSGAHTMFTFGITGASVYGELRFLLGESVNYSLTSNIIPALGEGAGVRNAARLEQLAGIDFIWEDVFTQDLITQPVASGTLEPGKYIFSYLASSGGGTSFVNGSFDFTMTPNVPDGGSTLMLLGLAICAIGGIFRKVNLA